MSTSLYTVWKRLYPVMRLPRHYCVLDTFIAVSLWGLKALDAIIRLAKRGVEYILDCAIQLLRWGYSRVGFATLHNHLRLSLIATDIGSGI